MRHPHKGVVLSAFTFGLLLPLFLWLVVDDEASAASQRTLFATATPAAETLHARLLSQPGPRVLLLGDTATFTFTFENTGSAAWIRGTSSEARLGVVSDDRHFADLGLADGWVAPDRPAAQLEPIVPPGATGTFQFDVRGQVSGLYRIPLGVLVEGVTWMDERAFIELLVR